MCEFVSWIEMNGKVLFLTDKDMERKKRGWKTKFPDKAEQQGHGALRWYYGIKDKDGVNKECTDFSKQSNFPKAIAKAIKDGRLTYGIESNIAKDVLTAQAYEVYKKARVQAYEVCEKARAQADEVYKKARAQAYEVYKKARAQADEVCEKATAPADEVYKKARAQAYEVYKKARAQAYEVREKATAPADEVYKKATAQLFCILVRIKKNRNVSWE